MDNINPDSQIQEELFILSDALSEGKFQEVLTKARFLLPSTKTRLNRASCHFMIGCALNELGQDNECVSHLLEAVALFPHREYALIGHTLLEIARTLLDLDLNCSALYYLELAISNFNALSRSDSVINILEECNKLKCILIERQDFLII